MNRTMFAASAAVFLFFIASPAPAQSPSPEGAPATTAQDQSPEGTKATRRSRQASGTKKEPTVAQLATRERQRKCSAEWKEAKAAGKLAPGAKWPKFWSECNARLKGKNV